MASSTLHNTKARQKFVSGPGSSANKTTGVFYNATGEKSKKSPEGGMSTPGPSITVEDKDTAKVTPTLPQSNAAAPAKPSGGFGNFQMGGKDN